MPKKHDDSKEIDDIVYDDAETVSDSIKKVKEKLKKCQEEKQEYLDGWQRSKADFVNYKKRAEEDKKEFVKYAIEDFVLELLPSLDSFDMAFKDKEAWNKAPETWRVGIEYIYNQIMGTLANRGVTVINPIGEHFEPGKHHSVAEIEGKEGEVVEVVLKGYMLGDKIIRAPHVKVGNGK